MITTRMWDEVRIIRMKSVDPNMIEPIEDNRTAKKSIRSYNSVQARKRTLLPAGFETWVDAYCRQKGERLIGSDPRKQIFLENGVAKVEPMKPFSVKIENLSALQYGFSHTKWSGIQYRF